MSSLSKIKLGDLFDVKVAGDLQKKFFSKKYSEETPFPIYSNSLSEKGLYGYTSKPRFNGGSITITGRGDLGHAEYRDTPFDAIVRLLVLIPKNEVDCKFITFYINHILKFAIESTGVPQLPAPRIKKIKIKIPNDVKEQKAISGILTKVDESIQLAKESINATENLKKALIQNLLTGKLKPDGTWRKEDEFYIDEKFGKVPLEWQLKKVKKCFDFYPTASYSRSKEIEKGDVYHIHYGDIHTSLNRILDLNDDKLPKIPEALSKKFTYIKEGDIIVADASEDWDGVGKCIEVINTNQKKIIASLHTLHLRPIAGDFILGFASYVFETYKVSINIKRLATGIKVYGISKPNLSKVLLPIPPENEQIKIKEKLDVLWDNIVSKNRKIKSLERLKKSLMQQLLTGKKRVNVKEVEKLLNQTKM
ncbi:type I restriction enzyme S subunit [Jejuia pallidilutea]|uniref:Type I restriction enzyme S subunit n=1 Tax=Jejuia pallidilutea TaxID=504487 RepID=A0A362X1L1_9FLAO|nr:restriction endonuclease subunit S [Jejuia pallidilutea]PQV50276.1 type I restriction enzyme S subunit [Jejuia pallidilutea]